MEDKVKDLISIIVPVYNVEKYLDRCVQSILNQTYPYFELILVDDGSSDNCGKMCDKYAKEDDRVIVIHQKNQGTACARNKGIDISKGEFIMFVDSDDVIINNFCERLHSFFISDTTLDCCVCGYNMIYENNNKVLNMRIDETMYCSGIEAIRERYLTGNNVINIVNPWGKMFKSYLWKNLRFTNGLYYEDLDIMPFLYHLIHKICFIPYIGYNYLIRDNSCSHGIGTDDKRVIDSIKIREKHINFYEDINEIKLKNKNIDILLDLITTCYKNNWIPTSLKKNIFIIYQKCFFEILRKDTITLKRKIYYFIYLSKNFFSNFILIKEVKKYK